MSRTLASIVWLPCLISCAAIPTAVLAENNLLDKVSFSALASTRMGIETDDGDDQLAEFVFTPEIEVDFGAGWRLTGIARFRLDGSDELEPGRPSDSNRDPISQRAFWGDDVDIELRELYLDGPIGQSFIRLGKQQIVWGEADGIKVLDVVNPQSFREFILPEFDDSRIPLWSLKTEIPVSDDVSLEAIWVPDQTYHDIPEADAAFAFTSPRFVPWVPPGAPVTVFEADRPSDFLDDSDAGAKLSAFVGGWQFSLNYFYHYLDIPVSRRSTSPGGISLTSEYERSHLVGGSFNNAFGNFVVRGEVAYLSDEYFLTDDILDTDGIEKSGEISYVVALDWTGLRDTFISAQLFQNIILDDAPGIVQDKVENTFTFYVRRSFINERVKASSLVIQSINDGDGVVEAELTYEWKSNIELFLGADIFYGKDRGVFGEFTDSSRVVFGIEIGI